MYRREKLLRLDVMRRKRVVYRAVNFVNIHVISIKLDVERNKKNIVNNIL